MSMIISTDVTISANVSAEEVRIVNDATLTLTGTLTCKKLIIERGKVVIESSGTINVVEEIPKPSPIMITMQYLMLIFMTLLFTYLVLIILKGAFKKEKIYYERMT